jgi:hypothetical protein
MIKNHHFLLFEAYNPIFENVIESPGRVNKKYVIFKNVNCVFWPKKD